MDAKKTLSEKVWADHVVKAEDGTPLDFAHDLFPDDLERIEENMMRAIDRVPAVGMAGIKRVINGPMIWSPDSNVLYGPHPDLQNYFCCCLRSQNEQMLVSECFSETL